MIDAFLIFCTGDNPLLYEFYLFCKRYKKAVFICKRYIYADTQKLRVHLKENFILQEAKYRQSWCTNVLPITWFTLNWNLIAMRTLFAYE